MVWNIVKVEYFDDWFLGLDARFYETMVPIAEREFLNYLQELE